MKQFTVGIDASNIRAGGGLTYLCNLLGAREEGGFADVKVIVWGGRKTLDRLPSRSWITKSYQPALDEALPSRVRWQQRRLGQLAAGCDVLFVPGGTYLGSFRPFVTMSHNLLPFEARERRRFGVSRTRLRLELLRAVQARTFQRADGMIFLTSAAESSIRDAIGPLAARSVIIPHGTSRSFLLAPREQKPVTAYSYDKPFRWLYVSVVNMYKHQWNVVAAAAKLRAAGSPISLELVGPAYPPALKKLSEAIGVYDPRAEFVRYHGPLAGDDLVRMYHDADALVFASTCENMPIILLEGMSAGLPIVCGDRPVMREVLRDGGAFCDPERVDQIAEAMQAITLRPDLRQALGRRAYSLACEYSWQRTADATFAFLQQVKSDQRAKS